MNYREEVRKLISTFCDKKSVTIPYTEGAELEASLVKLMIRVSAIGPKDNSFWLDVDASIKNDNKIGAVTKVKNASGLGLKESVKLIETVYPRMSKCLLCKKRVTKCECNPDGHPLSK